jgi:hypothetical protein
VKKGVLYSMLLIIAVSTLISGLVQLVNPAFVLGVVSAEQTATARHFFGIVGMFMALFGGMLLQALTGAGQSGVVILWSGVQKLGASAAVGIGVLHHIFSSLTLAIAGFDFLSGLLIFAYLWKTSDAR